jgi:tetratricopeptide (TPR) repeat protein
VPASFASDVPTSPNPTNAAIAEAATQFALARQQSEQDPHNPQAGWQFGRACFDLAEFATNHSQRAQLAHEGITACQKALTVNSNSAPAHYYLGMNLGQLARTKGLGALKLVSQMRREFSVARDLDEHFDHAGPDRNLGLLYRDAPSIGSIGSRSKAQEHLLRAVEVAPEYPENRLDLMEAYLKWGEHEPARKELEALGKSLPDALKNFSGPAWSSTWADWDERFDKARHKIREQPKTVHSPRH